MDYLIETHLGNNVWIEAKENALRGFREFLKTRIEYELSKEDTSKTELVAINYFKKGIK